MEKQSITDKCKEEDHEMNVSQDKKPNTSIQAQGIGVFPTMEDNIKMENFNDNFNTYNQSSDAIELEKHDIKEIFHMNPINNDNAIQEILHKHTESIDKTLSNLRNEIPSLKLKIGAQESASATTSCTLENKTSQENAEIDLFFKSISTTLKKMSPYSRAMAKLKILSAITELEVNELRNSKNR